MQRPATIGIAQGRGSGGAELEAVDGKTDVGGQNWSTVRLANIACGRERVIILVNSAAQPVRMHLIGIPATARLSVLSGGDAAKLEKGDQAIEAALEPFAAMVGWRAGRNASLP